jgi:hypothetical protein
VPLGSTVNVKITVTAPRARTGQLSGSRHRKRRRTPSRRPAEHDVRARRRRPP